MSISAFLRDLAARDIQVALSGNKLLLRASAGLLTEATRAEIAARKDDIIAFLRSGKARVAAPIELRKAPHDAPLALSFAQQRLWFLHKLEPESAAYNLGAGVEIPTAVDQDVLHASLDRLANRHDVLRTIFVESDGVPYQVVTGTLVQLRVADLRQFPAERRDAECLRVRDEEVARPFDLAAAPPFRALLIRRDDAKSLFVFTVHHIIADGWSLSLIVKELGELYDAIQSGREPQVPELPIQYADYAYSERRWFEETGEEAHKEFWKERLSGTLASLDLPIDRPRGRTMSARGGTWDFSLPADVAERLRELGRRSKVTLFTMLLTVFKTMLHRYTGQSDIIVGTAVANRKHVELESMVGMFVSTLPLRTDISGDPTARELLRRVHETVLSAHEHRDYPFEKLVELTRTERSLGQAPLFQSAFVLHNTPGAGTYQNLSSGSMFELSLYVRDVPGELPATLEYNADLFDRATIARMAGHLVTLAESLVAHPDQPISRLELLTRAEETQLLHTWNATQTSFDESVCVHTLFERQVRATPDAIALVAPKLESSGETVRMTYRELDQLANQIAHRLREFGVGPDKKVAIALDRSTHLVASLLAVWKAGGAYVPLDPEYPADRLAFMIEDAGVAAMVTREAVRSTIPKVTCPVIDLDADAPVIRSAPDTPPPSVGNIRDLAYVIYTSGSTGRPKGVLLEHRSLINFLRSMQREPGMTSDDTLLSVTTLSFDIAGLELYLPLITGARVVLVSRAVATDGVRLAEAIRSSGTTIMQATPATWRLLLESGWPSPRTAPTKPIRVLCGGEAMPRSLANAMLDSGAVSELWNMFGPTETTIWSTLQRVSRDDRDPVPIGRPIANTTLYVLDANRQPVPVNVAGELYIGGMGLARGYHQRPELTAERFVADPFTSTPAARFYRTGDRARYRSDGTVEFLGRLDDQVKIRGFRIELGEIESTLARHPQIAQAVVVASDDATGNQRLIAYLLGADDERVDSAELRRWLAKLLPQYMIPAAFAFVDAYPLTPNGKVDRRALLANGVSFAQSSRSSLPLQPGIESIVGRVWCDTLNVPQVWADDNFFELGGNSLLGVRLLANLEKAVGQRLPVSVLFEGPTVRAMAAALGNDFGDEAMSLAVRIRSGGDRPPLFIVPGINGNVIGYETLAHALPARVPVYGLRSLGLDGEAEPLADVKAIAARFLEEVRRVQPHGPYFLCGFCIGGIIAYEMAQRLVAQGERIELLALIGTWPPWAVEDNLSPSPSVAKLAFIRDAIIRHVKAIQEKPLNERLRYVVGKAKILSGRVARGDEYFGDPAEIRQDLIARVNRHAAAVYKPLPFDGDILMVIPDDVSPPAEQDLRLVWRNLVSGEATVVRLPGEDSGMLLRPTHLDALVGVLAGRLQLASLIDGQ